MYILFGFIFIPIYISLNWKYLKEKKISPWFNISNLEVEKTKFFKYQFLSSVITCFIIAIALSLFIILKLSYFYFPLLVMLFYILLYLIKYIAITKGYLIKK